MDYQEDAMNKQEQEVKDQIFAMMEYLGCKRKYISLTPLRPRKHSYFDLTSRSIIDGGDETFLEIQNTHRELAESCKVKAIQKWVNIELANNNLFWCVDE